SVVIRILPLILILSCPVISGWELSRPSMTARKASEVSSCCSVIGLEDGAARGYMRDTEYAPVAQLDRASGFEPEGWEFKSLRARHFRKVLLWPYRCSCAKRIGCASRAFKNSSDRETHPNSASITERDASWLVLGNSFPMGSPIQSASSTHE